MDIDGRKPRVLCVEDDPMSAELVRGVLEQAGYTCVTAASAIEGIRFTLSEHMDLLILDLNLPGVSGVDFLRMLRELGVPVPVVITSAYGTQLNIAAVTSLGVKSFLVKPIAGRDLLKQVAATIPRRTLPYPLLGGAGVEAGGMGPPSGAAFQARSGASEQAGGVQLRLVKTRLEAVQASLESTQRRLELAEKEAEEAKEALVDSTRALIGLLDKRQAFSGSHGARVAEYAQKLGKRLQLPETSRHILEVAALLHDVGKITMPEDLMTKAPETLAGQELAAYMRHAEAGAAIIEHMTSGDRVARIVRSHHERFDGKGFPDRLQPSDIPLEARIIAVANGLDRLLLQSPATPTNFTAARQSLRRMRGTAYDPVIADHALELVDELEAFELSHTAVSVPVGSLAGGEILAQDVESPDGLVILPRGTVITDRYRDKLRMLAQDKRAHSTLMVYEIKKEAAR